MFSSTFSCQILRGLGLGLGFRLGLGLGLGQGSYTKNDPLKVIHCPYSVIFIGLGLGLGIGLGLG